MDVRTYECLYVCMYVWGRASSSPVEIDTCSHAHIYVCICLHSCPPTHKSTTHNTQAGGAVPPAPLPWQAYPGACFGDRAVHGLHRRGGSGRGDGGVHGGLLGEGKVFGCKHTYVGVLCEGFLVHFLWVYVCMHAYVGGCCACAMWAIEHKWSPPTVNNPTPTFYLKYLKKKKKQNRELNGHFGNVEFICADVLQVRFFVRAMRVIYMSIYVCVPPGV